MLPATLVAVISTLEKSGVWAWTVKGKVNIAIKNRKSCRIRVPRFWKLKKQNRSTKATKNRFDLVWFSGSNFFPALGISHWFRIERLCFRVLEYSDKRQVAIAFGVIKSVANDEVIRDLKSQVINLHFAFAPLELVQQSHKFHACGAARFQVGHQIRKRQAGVDNVFHDNQVAAFHRNVEILQDANLT